MRKTAASLFAFGALFALTLAAPAGHAAPIVWTINNGTFSDGGTFSGTFTYDPTADTYGAFSISVTAVGNFTAFTYTDTAGATAGSGGTISGHPIHAFTASANRLIFFPFNPDLSSAGGTFSIFLSPGNASELLVSPFTMRDIATGEASGSAVPEPSTVVSFSIGIVALVLIRHHKLRRQ